MTISEKDSRPRKTLSLFGEKKGKKEGYFRRIDKIPGKKDESR